LLAVFNDELLNRQSRYRLQRLVGSETDTLRAKLQGVRGVRNIFIVVVFVDDLTLFKTSRAHGAE
jgi:hypothetical protein